MGIKRGHSVLHSWSRFGHSDNMYLSYSLSISGHSGHSGHSKSNKIIKNTVSIFVSNLYLCAFYFVRVQSALTTMTTMTSIDNQRLKKSYSMTTHYDQKRCTMTIKGLLELI